MPHTIRTDRLLLRPYRLRDARALAAVVSSPAMSAPTKTWPWPVTEDHARFRLGTFLKNQESGESFGFAIQRGPRMVGLCGGQLLYGSRYAIGYSIAQEFWGQGYGTEAIRALCGFAFRTLRVARIEAAVFKDNPGSIGVLEKTGFWRTGDIGPGWSTTLQTNLPRWGYALTRERLLPGAP